MNITDLVAKLKSASEAYYNGHPLMDDASYDALEAELRKLDLSHPFLQEVGAPVHISKWGKVRHDYPLLSLNKAQNSEEMRKWVARFENQDFLAMWKYDGLACTMKWVGGKLTLGATRGDSEIGEDITPNVRKMQGIPQSLSIEGTLHIRGEIVCKRSDFRCHFKDAANPRNIASGTSKRLDGIGCEYLSIIVYDVRGGDFATRTEALEKLQKEGFQVADRKILSSFQEIEDFYQLSIRSRSNVDFDTDGLVILTDSFSSYDEAGELGGRPAAAIAYKFPHETAETRVRNIIWQVGSQGRITPVMVFDPVFIDGAILRNASLHNVNNIQSLLRGKNCFQNGDLVKISRRNGVIPFCEELLSPSQETGGDLGIPETCPVCNAATTMVGEYLICTNEDECPAQTAGRIYKWLAKLEIMDWGLTTVEALAEEGLVANIADLYKLEVQDLANLQLSGRVLGASAARRMLDNLHAKKSLTLPQFFGSLSIPLIGRSMVEIITSQMKNPTKESFLSLTVRELCSFDGVQEKKATALVDGLAKRRDLIESIFAAGVSIQEVKDEAGPLKGMAVCFTGFRDKAKQDRLVALGAVVKDSYSKAVTHLVAKSVAGSSTKLDKARKDGAKVMSIEELDALLVGYPAPTPLGVEVSVSGAIDESNFLE